MAHKQRLYEFYQNKNILITGATGCLGLGLVEKLLYGFPQIGTIFLIVRSKKNHSVDERKEAFLENEAFARLKSKNINFQDKIVCLEGDLSEPKMGLSQDSENIIKESANIIFHSAATISFMERLKIAINLNIGGTQRLLNLATQCKQINSFVHISTAYCNSRKSGGRLKEKLYPHPIPPQDLLRIAQTESVEKLDAETKQYIMDWPNTYTYTKNATENLVYEYRNKLPVGVFRPGIIVHSLNEPYRYWLHNPSGYAKILLESSKGYVLKTNPSANSNCIPIDMTVNALIATAYDIAQNKGEMKFYNYTSNNNPSSFTESSKYYLDGANVGKPMFGPLYYKIKCYLNDFILQLNGKEKRYVKDYKRHQFFLGIASYFSTKAMYFDNNNIENLWESLTPEEKEQFFFNINDIDWRSFFVNMHKAISKPDSGK